jgi:curli biogenesis system outer membrane secretion channel CsgG
MQHLTFQRPPVRAALVSLAATLLALLATLLAVLLGPQEALAQTAAAAAPGGPRVAVTELAYQTQVREHFEVSTSKTQQQMRADSTSLSSGAQAEGQRVSGSHSTLSQGELRRFTADLRGLMLTKGGLRLVQGRAFDAGEPQPSKAELVLEQVNSGKLQRPVRQPDVQDIVSRIKKGEFAGADYVLFGSVSEVQVREEVSPLQGTTTQSQIYSLELVAEFSLIHTGTLEIKAAFSASGSGSDVKLVSQRRDTVVANRAKVAREVSQSLAEDAYQQLSNQLGLVPRETTR